MKMFEYLPPFFFCIFWWHLKDLSLSFKLQIISNKKILMWKKTIDLKHFASKKTLNFIQQESKHRQ
jgi:hypothetical protein